MSESVCGICGGRQGTEHRVREMMFGTRAIFRYFECASCNCCQLADQVDVELHYPEEYHAYMVQGRPPGIRGWLRKQRNRSVFRGRSPLRLLDRLAPYPVYGAHRWFRRMRVRPEHRILDVGCGSGELVRDLLDAGFTRAEGIDPFLPDDVLGRLPPSIRKAWLHETAGEYDVIMMHHVLEHVPDQEATLSHVARLLRPGGHCLVRVPVTSGEAWRRYHANWVQLDAPRHLFIHSEKSLEMVAARAGLELEHVEHDSTEFQFTGSELYRRDIPLTELAKAYTSASIRGFRRESRRLNAKRQGDQAAFYLRKSVN